MSVPSTTAVITVTSRREERTSVTACRSHQCCRQEACNVIQFMFACTNVGRNRNVQQPENRDFRHRDEKMR
jgi:hypothetical protein